MILPKFYPVPIEVNTLAHYGRELGLNTPQAALAALAQAIAASVGQEDTALADACLVIRSGPQPLLAILGRFNADQEAQLAAQLQRLGPVCACLRYITYAQAEQDCMRLAELLVQQVGRDRLQDYSFTAIPRGGLIVLGMLAYALGLKRAQLEPLFPPTTPLVIVDDCAFSGLRFNRFLENCPNPKIIFAHLYSHPELRAAIVNRESRVVACLAAQDLHTLPHRQQDSNWQERRLAQSNGHYYWLGRTEHVCFPWNEPDRSIYNLSDPDKAIGCLPVIPPQFCLKNRLPPGCQALPVQVQAEGKGPLKPSPHVLFGEFEEQVIVGHLETRAVLGLADTAAAMWRAIVEYGNIEDVICALLKEYAVDETTLRADLRAFVDELLARQLLEYTC